MKKNKNNIIKDWLNKYGDVEIEKKVKKEIKQGLSSPIVAIKVKGLETTPQEKQ